jgi:hypothetical protein
MRQRVTMSSRRIVARSVPVQRERPVLLAVPVVRAVALLRSATTPCVFERRAVAERSTAGWFRVA